MIIAGGAAAGILIKNKPAEKLGVSSTAENKSAADVSKQSAKAVFTDLSDKSVGDIIEFGSYPQSEVTDENIIDALSKINKNWVSYGNYVFNENHDDFYVEKLYNTSVGVVPAFKFSNQ